MGQFFGNEKITKLVKSSSTVVSLPSGTVIKTGGQGYTNSSAIICTTSVSGFGGIDTGSIAASTFYYVYAVVNAGVLGLVASTSATSPTGFNGYRKVGAFYTDGSSNIFKAYWFGEVNQTMFSAKLSGAGTVTEENFDWINGNAVVAANLFTSTLNTGIFSVAPNCVASCLAGAGNDYVAKIVSASNTTIVTQTNSDAVFTPASHQIVVQKAGIDANQPDWSL